MEQFKLFTTYSAWFIPLCLLIGAGYAWLLYAKNTPWSRNLNYLLAFLRFVVVSFLCFLLLGPVIRYFSNSTEKPAVVFAIDTSESVKLFTQPSALQNTTKGLQEISRKLAEKGIASEVKTFTEKTGNDFDKLQFNQKTTNLDALLTNIAETYENRNLPAVVLLSDGIVNQGKSPVYADYQFQLFPVVVGDTVPKKDISIPSLQFNKVAFSGNKFPIVAEIRNDGFGAAATTVILRENGRVIDTKTVTIQKNQAATAVTFTLTAAQPGKKHYEIGVKSLPGEFTTVNNSKHAYIEVIKGRLKVLLAASVPHPDIKALKSAIETDDNYEVSLYLPGIKPLVKSDYDLVIMHQLPSRTGAGADVLQMVQTRKIPAFYIVGAQTDFNELNKLQTGVFISPRSNQSDEVSPVINTAFSRFGFAENSTRMLTNYPPVTVPFADFRLSPNTEVVLNQQVGSLKTNRPLMAVQTGTATPGGILLGEGIWQWRLNEAAATEKPVVFDKLITNTVQLLTTKQNKKRLNVYPVQDEFLISDEVRFQAEAYNTIFEKIYGQTITLRLTDEKNKSRSYSFVNGESLSGLSLGNLPGGVYKYVASATLNGKPEKDAGEFLVQELELENMTSLANPNLLHQLARKNGSRLYYPNQLDQLEADLLKADFKSIIYTQESLKDLINLKWLFFVIVGLITIEWFLRKYYGGI